MYGHERYGWTGLYYMYGNERYGWTGLYCHHTNSLDFQAYLQESLMSVGAKLAPTRDKIKKKVQGRVNAL